MAQLGVVIGVIRGVSFHYGVSSLCLFIIFIPSKCEYHPSCLWLIVHDVRFRRHFGGDGK